MFLKFSLSKFLLNVTPWTKILAMRLSYMYIEAIKNSSIL